MMNTQNNKSRIHDYLEGNIAYVLGIIIFIQSIYPITESGSILMLLIYEFAYAILIFAGIFVARDNRRLQGILTVSGSAWLITTGIYTFNTNAVWAIMLANVVFVIFQGGMTLLLAQYVFRARTITRDVIYAAIAVYLLLGAIFVPIYGIIDTLTFIFNDGVNAFSGTSNAVGSVVPWQDFVYYSYVTLTTLGYGDILPVTMLARVAVSTQAIIGVMYLTIIMARLVSLYSTEVALEDIESERGNQTDN